MLDINYVRKYPDIVKKNLEKRQDSEKVKLLEKLLKIDKSWRKVKLEVDNLRSKRNKINLEINAAKKAGKKVTTLVKEAKTIPKKLIESEDKLLELKKEINYSLMKLPNLLEASVPYGKDENDNKVVKKYGKKPKFTGFKPKDHIELLKKWKLAELDRAGKISGARWFFLQGKLARLELALMSYAADFLMKKDYNLIVPPHMICRKAYEGVVSLESFEEDLYKIDGEDLFCIATSEHPLVGQYMNFLIEEKLPLKLAGVSFCFRKEAGTHGKEDKGIFRVHQFAKIEQVIICYPEDSWELHEELKQNMLKFFESLELHFRIVNLCTADISTVSAKTYDLEAWMPAQGKYREMGSCSNCLSYQATRLNTKFVRDNKREYVHTLNSTCVAVERAMAAILENFQDKKGVIQLPKVLHKYCGFKKIGGSK